MKPNQNNNSNRDTADAIGDDSFVRQQLELLGQPEPIDPRFREHLSEQLDEAFAAAMAEANVDSEIEVDHDNASTNRQLNHATQTQVPRSSSGRSSSGRRLPRWLGGLVAASVLTGLLSFWLSQPLTSWAEMIEALKSTPWVQTDSGRTSSWISASNQIVARRDANQTVFCSQDSGTYSSYVRKDDRIYQTNATQKWLPLEDDLIAWLAGSSNSSNGSLGLNVNWTLVSESTRAIDDSLGRWLELTVVFESDQSPAHTFTAVFLLNPETKLPVSCRVRPTASPTVNATDSSLWRTVSFDYPNDGPADIFDLGVAAETPIMLAANDSNVGLAANKVKEKSTAELAVLEKRSAKPIGLLDLKSKSLDSSTTKTDPVVAEAPAAPEPKPPVVAFSNGESTAADPAAKAAPKKSIPIVPIPATSGEMTARVNQLVEALWKEKKIVPVDQTSDEAFLRRVYLDVIGRVPTIGEYAQFFELHPEVRRRRLIDQLLDSREHALHMGGIWKRVLVPDDETAISRLGGSGKLERWLSDSFADNQPYDEMVSKILLAEGRVNESGPLLFYAAAKMNAEELAARTSRSFLGMRMECAQCHDHPYDDWSQEDFWGLAAYFAQISRPQGKIEMVSPVLRVRDADFGDVKLPETEIVIKPSLPFGQNDGHGMTESDIAELKNAVVTDGSRRQQLATWITSPQNSRFSQATVNRIWAHLFGRGIINPVDDMGGYHEPISPQLLNQLGRYFVQSDFDVRELMRVLLNSRAYQLSSEVSDKKTSEQVDIFARMSLKPLTAEQLYDCLATATGRTDLGSQVNSTTQLNIASDVDRFTDPGRAAFLSQFRTSVDQRTDYQAGIPQALTLMNGPMIASATSDAPKGILRSLSAPFFDDKTRVEKLFIATLSRKPTDDEQQRYAKFVDSQPTTAKKSETLGDVLWVLLNSTEFTMNH